MADHAMLEAPLSRELSSSPFFNYFKMWLDHLDVQRNQLTRIFQSTSPLAIWQQ